MANKYTLAAFLDVSSAYDNVNGRILIENLKKEGCPKKIIKYIDEWIYYRNATFIVAEENIIKRSLFKRLPQGAVLSQILYSLYTKNIMVGISDEIEKIQFADDVALYITIRNREENRDKLEEAVK